MPILAAWLTVDALALDLVAPTGLRPGQLATFTVTGGTPGQDVGLVFGGPGPGPCPRVLAGSCLDVSAPTLAAAGTVGPDGTLALQVAVPANAPLVDVRFQAAEAGGSPSVSPVRVVPVVTALTGLTLVRSAADLEVARHAWRVEDLRFLPGAYPSAVTLPALERATSVTVSTATRDLSLPALVAADRLELDGTPGARISADALQGPDVAPATTLAVVRNTGQAGIVASVLADVASVQVMENTAAVVVTAPAITSAPSVVLSRNAGDLSRVVPTLRQASQVTSVGHDATTLDVLPALRTAVSVTVGDSPTLQALQLGVVGLTVTGDATLERNAALLDIAGFQPSVVNRAKCSDNRALASCACEALFAVSAIANGVYCYGNAPDTCSDDPADLCF